MLVCEAGDEVRDDVTGGELGVRERSGRRRV